MKGKVQPKRKKTLGRQENINRLSLDRSLDFVICGAVLCFFFVDLDSFQSNMQPSKSSQDVDAMVHVSINNFSLLSFA